MIMLKKTRNKITDILNAIDVYSRADDFDENAFNAGYFEADRICTKENKNLQEKVYGFYGNMLSIMLAKRLKNESDIFDHIKKASEKYENSYCECLGIVYRLLIHAL